MSTELEEEVIEHQAKPKRALFLASFAALFLELALIRWMPTTVHVFSFYANVVLIATFLGLGVGMARSADHPPTVSIALRFATLLTVSVGLGVIDPPLRGQSRDINLNEAAFADSGVPMWVLVLLVFALSAWAVVPLGQTVGSTLDRIPGRLRAYNINILGSLAGVLGFAVVSGLGLPPIAWFAIGIGLVVMVRPTRSVVPPLLIMAMALAVQVYDDSAGPTQLRWSPYYKVLITPLAADVPLDQGFVVDVNDQFLLSGLDLRSDASVPEGVSARTADEVRLLASYYDLPFSLRPPGDVLILGSGAGNDVAAALRAGALTVTAVEIDPVVHGLGQEFHPEDPFGDRRVDVVIDDGRSYLRTADRAFDLVLYATLDAHGLIANAGSVRLDSFIYTRESLEAAKALLKPGGIMVLSFGPFREDVQLRQRSMVASVFDQDPLYLEHANGHRTMVAGDVTAIDAERLSSEWRVIPNEEVLERSAAYPAVNRPATDDWPYLYVAQPGIPREYWVVLIGMAAVSLILVVRSFSQLRGFDPHFFFLGAGFLLMETKSVTEFALLVGSTWRTNALVFAVILLVVYLANMAVIKERLRIPQRSGYAVIFFILALQWLSFGRLGGLPTPVQVGLAALLLGGAVFMSAVVFARSFSRVTLASTALAANLVGSVLGGALEYSSLAFGLRASTILAAAMYGLSWLSLGVRASPARLSA